MVKRVAAIIFIFLVASVAWGALGVLTEFRTRGSSDTLGGAVSELWGAPHVQPAPAVYGLVPPAQAPGAAEVGAAETAPKQPAGASVGSGLGPEGTEGGGRAAQPDLVRVPVPLTSSDIKACLALDYRKKGLLWFSTYNVDFSGRWTAANPYAVPRRFVIVFRFPTSETIYDNFSFTVNGHEAATRKTADGSLEADLTLAPGEDAVFASAYRSRGLDSWTYLFGRDVTQVRNFTLQINTDFKDIDFPPRTISPTAKEETATGWRLVWRYENLISGFQIGLEMPHRLNPGPLAARISFFAPVSLLFFFFVIFVLGVLRGVNLHPMHYLFLAAAFFSFHLLFAYLVDHVDVNYAFAAASAVSVGLVVSYLRLVAGNRFAFVEAGLAQLLYLVLFSYTHLLEGFTGLTVTVGAILTLFALMQLTARVDWDAVFGASGAKGERG